jgi:hypothetical protein
MATRSFARSLYWRIGLGFILFLAITLVLQVALFIYVAGTTEGGMPARMGRDFAELVAAEFEAALARDPQLDLRRYAEQRVNETCVSRDRSVAVVLMAVGDRRGRPTARCWSVRRSDRRAAVP